jgi:hypothetical protein
VPGDFPIAQHGAKELAMNHAEIDPSLCTGEPTLESLDDGFSPPVPATGAEDARQPASDDAESFLGTKSPF